MAVTMQGFSGGGGSGGLGGLNWLDVQSADSKAAQVQQQAELNYKYQVWGEQVKSQKEAAQQMGAGMSSLVNDYNRAFAEAKSEYENRYQSMLGLVAQNSGQQAADINTAAGNTAAAQRAGLSKLGMGNTTVGSSLAAGTERERIAEQNLLSDKFAQQKLGVMGSKQTSKDWAPDRSAISGLLSSTAGGAGAYGVGALSQALGALKQ